jgi:flagellar protein FliO/FliZ
MDSIITPELPQFLRLIIALAIVLSLMGGLALLLKKLGLAEKAPTLRNNKRRLRLVESLPLDARRRLVLLECDDKQHLVILSATSETLIKSDIPTPPVDESSKADEGS